MYVSFENIFSFTAFSFVSLRIIEYRKGKKQEKVINDYIRRPLENPFSFSDYLSKIENEYAKILKKREEKPKYTTILWIGLDGLRLNEDGTSEWIKKEAKKEEEKNILNTIRSYYPSYYISYPGYMYYQPMQSIFTYPLSCYQQINSSIQQQTQQIDRIKLLEAQSCQMQNIINCLNKNNLDNIR